MFELKGGKEERKGEEDLTWHCSICQYAEGNLDMS